MDPAWWITLGGVATLAISVVSSIIAGRRGADREWERVAQARGAELSDLRAEVAELRLEVSNLNGQMKALQALKASEIANEVIVALAPFLKKAAV